MPILFEAFFETRHRRFTFDDWFQDFVGVQVCCCQRSRHIVLVKQKLGTMVLARIGSYSSEPDVLVAVVGQEDRDPLLRVSGMTASLVHALFSFF